MELDHVPALHRRFLEQALPALESDPRLIGVAAAGSFLSRDMDDFSDVDLVIAVEPENLEEVMHDRRGIAASLGNLLAAFTGEHVGEPRVLICLYGPEPLHVDLKFVSLDDLSERIEDPVVLWERDDRPSRQWSAGDPTSVRPDLQWIEDRFWIWIHYAATKIGRGELFEAVDFLAFLRNQVLGPMTLQRSDALPSGVRKIEQKAPGAVEPLQQTLASYEPSDAARALRAAIALYLDLREQLAPDDLIRGRSAEVAALEYLDAIETEG